MLNIVRQISRNATSLDLWVEGALLEPTMLRQGEQTAHWMLLRNWKLHSPRRSPLLSRSGRLLDLIQWVACLNWRLRVSRLVQALALAFALGWTLPLGCLAGTHHAVSQRATFPTFTTESAAQAHCPSDIVVWLNTRSGVWHTRGERWYGRTKHGAYACKGEATNAGYRGSENGQ